MAMPGSGNRLAHWRKLRRTETTRAGTDLSQHARRPWGDLELRLL